MSKMTFTPEQLDALRNNPYVDVATERRISYTLAFKKKFVEEYRQGKSPSQIFRDAGFDVAALGRKRIERASDRWRTDNNEGRLGAQSDYVEVHSSRGRVRYSDNDLMAKQAKLIWQLQAENAELRKKLAMLSGTLEA